jgi:uncharacterized membrane protein YphA (DoxX/SURF4 family)
MGLLQQAVATLGGAVLLAGLWTPVMGGLVALNEVATSLAVDGARPEERWIHMFLATISAGIAMLGPGAWSIDAKLFGRKRFDSSRPRSGSR